MTTLHAQADSIALPYHQIPDYPADYTAGNILSRMVDGLGYRYYWASKDLTEENLNYTPPNDGKSTLKTLEHLAALSDAIVSAAQNKPSVRPLDLSKLSYYDLRALTLRNLKMASDSYRGKTAEEIAELKVMFQRGERTSTFDFWHEINGPIADAIYHTGQIVSFRRTSGNPVQLGVNVFMGKTKE